MHGVAVDFYDKQNSHNNRKHCFIRRFGLCVSHHQELYYSFVLQFLYISISAAIFFMYFDFRNLFMQVS